MQKYIYKIENLINHNLYIGQSVNPQKRFQQHCTNNQQNYRSLIHLAILKYGKENFEMTIIEGPIENYNEREKYWINYYHTWIGDAEYRGGYNLTPGGEEPPVLKGLNNPSTTHSLEQVFLAKRLLKETNISIEAIAEACGYENKSSIHRINIGKMWNDPNESYPLRVLVGSKSDIKQRWEKVSDLLYNTDLTQKEIAELCGCTRSCVTMINIGENGKEYNNGKYSYPIRSGNMSYKQREKQARQIAKDLAETDLPYFELKEKYQCSHAFLSQINQGHNYKFDIYSYPIRKYYNKPVETMEGQSSSTLPIDTAVETGIATIDKLW